jgi:hypothetical protein
MTSSQPVLRLFDPSEKREGKPPRKPRACKIVLKVVRSKGDGLERALMYERPFVKRSG